MRFTHGVKLTSSMKKGITIVQAYLEDGADEVVDLMLPSCRGHLTYAIVF